MPRVLSRSPGLAPVALQPAIVRQSPTPADRAAIAAERRTGIVASFIEDIAPICAVCIQRFIRLSKGVKRQGIVLDAHDGFICTGEQCIRVENETAGMVASGERILHSIIIVAGAWVS
jgi:hypothetical protein